MKSSQQVLFFIIFGALFVLPEALLAFEDTSLPPKNINAVWYDHINNGTPIAIVLPTHEADEVSQQMIHEYVSQIFSGLHAVDMLTDDEALVQSMMGKNIFAYGTPEGNTWLAEHFASLPFHIDPNQIIAGEVIEGSDLRLIAVWDNPDDPNKGLVVYTAQQTKDVVGIHSVFHGPTQFVIAREQQILRQGYYIPTDDGWSFSEYPYVDFPDFTHEQKLEDFDAMVSIIRDVFPAAQVNRMVYGLDIEQTLAAYREDVSDANTTEEFVTLLDRAIKACKGSHMDTDYVGTDYYASSEFLRSYTAGYLDEDTVRIHELYRDYLWIRNEGFALNLPLIYYQGEYYVLYDFTFEDTFFARGLKVESCNGCTPDEIL